MSLKLLFQDHNQYLCNKATYLWLRWRCPYAIINIMMTVISTSIWSSIIFAHLIEVTNSSRGHSTLADDMIYLKSNVLLTSLLNNSIIMDIWLWNLHNYSSTNLINVYSSVTFNNNNIELKDKYRKTIKCLLIVQIEKNYVC